MSTSRLMSLFVAVVVVVAAVFTLGLAANAGTSAAALDQHDRHPGFINQSLTAASSAALDQSDRHPIDVAALAEQARIEFRRGEWNAGTAASSAALDQSDRHPIDAAALAEQARIEYRRGEWSTGGGASAAAFDVEQARLQWRAAK